MRVIAGTHRGRRLHAPPGDATRPMLDRQKETVFNLLQGDLPGPGVVDVFAGSGGLGIEALSRGAEFGTFVEGGRHALPTLKRNLAELGLAERAHVLGRDAFTVDVDRVQHGFGLVFLDPPFPLYASEPHRVVGLAQGWLWSTCAADGVVLVFRIPAGSPPPTWPAGVSVRRERAFGESLIFFLTREDPNA